MKPQKQTILGEGGNCFATCVAILLDIDVKDVPNFCWGKNNENWWEGFQKWLVDRGMFAIEVNQSTSMAPVPIGTIAILNGMGKRDLLHSVVGKYSRIEDGKTIWEFLYDPHPSNNYIESADSLCFIVKAIVEEP